MGTHHNSPVGSALPLLLPLLVAASVLLTGVKGATKGLGVNWGTMASNPLPPDIVVQMLKDNKIQKVKLFDADSRTLKALEDSKLEVMVGLPNIELEKVGDYDNAKAWVKQNVTKPLEKGVDIRYVAVGNEPFLTSYNGSNLKTLYPALLNIQQALEDAGHAKKVKATVPQNADVYESSSDSPSGGDFRSDIKSNMVQIVKFFKKKKLPFTVNIYPYLSLYQNKNFPVDFAFFGNHGKTIHDNGKSYTNVFDANYDTLVHTLKKHDCADVKIIVGEIGWPTDGANHATRAEARRFYHGLIEKLSGDKGTPLRPGHLEVYLFGLLDENMKSIEPGPFERHWGIFEYDGKPKFQLDLAKGGDKKTLVAAKDVDYMESQWCVLDWDVKDLAGLPEAMTWSCSRADCTRIGPDGSCESLSVKQRASYAFNMFFQMNQQALDACDFNGLGRLTKDNATVGTCLFPIEIESAANGVIVGSIFRSFVVSGFVLAFVMALL